MNKLVELILVPIRHLYMLLVWRLRGWQTVGQLPDLDKFIVTGAPHTSNEDYFLFLGGAAQLGRRARVTIKKEWFFPPLSWILGGLGGIPIDRSGSKGLVDQLVDFIKQQERIVLVFTPEGTRSYRDHWKTGFYHVAVKAGVPIVPVALNYAQKRIYYGAVFYPTGDMETDFAFFRDWYGEYGAGRYPEKVNDVRIRGRKKDAASPSEEEVA